VEIAVGTSVSLDKVTCRAQELLAEVFTDVDGGAATSTPIALGAKTLGVPESMPAAETCKTPST
jgi:hypothetical protein